MLNKPPIVKRSYTMIENEDRERGESSSHLAAEVAVRMAKIKYLTWVEILRIYPVKISRWKRGRPRPVGIKG